VAHGGADIALAVHQLDANLAMSELINMEHEQVLICPDVVSADGYVFVKGARWSHSGCCQRTAQGGFDAASRRHAAQEGESLRWRCATLDASLRTSGLMNMESKLVCTVARA
jgi:hypothetical protein